MRRSDFFWGKKIGNGIGVTVLRVAVYARGFRRIFVLLRAGNLCLLNCNFLAWERGGLGDAPHGGVGV